MYSNFDKKIKNRHFGNLVLALIFIAIFYLVSLFTCEAQVKSNSILEYNGTRTGGYYISSTTERKSLGSGKEKFKILVDTANNIITIDYGGIYDNTFLIKKTKKFDGSTIYKGIFKRECEALDDYYRHRCDIEFTDTLIILSINYGFVNHFRYGSTKWGEPTK